MKVSGQSASADVKTGGEYFETLDKLILEEKCFSEKIFNIDETSLFQKQCLKELSAIRRPHPCHVSKILTNE